MNKPVQSDGTVGKALVVLDAVVGFGRAVRFSELHACCGFPKATAHRLLQTLTKQGLLYYDPARHTYSPGMRLVRISQAAWRQSSLEPLARPHIEALSAEVGETVHLAQMERGQVVFIEKITPREGFRTLANPGGRAPVHCTGVGKAMLANLAPAMADVVLTNLGYEVFTPATHRGPDTLLPELDEIRKSGIAYDREEHEAGIISIAAPIFGGGGAVIGALSIVTSPLRMSLAELDRFGPTLLRTSAQIGGEAALWPYPVAQ